MFVCLSHLCVAPDIFPVHTQDGNGSVDLNEFMVGMTEVGGSNNSSKDEARLQSVFFDFANLHRRQKIIERMQDPSLGEIIPLTLN